MNKMTEKVGVCQLRKIFEQIILKEKCPKEWEDSHTVVVYKGKDDALDCGNYRGIRLLEHESVGEVAGSQVEGNDYH